MATQWISPTWRMPKNSNQSKVDNYSLSFNGTDEYIDLTQHDLGTVNTISFWLKRANTDAVGETIFGEPSNTFKQLVYIDWAANFFYYKDPANNKSIWNISASNDTDWHNYTVTRNGTATILYVDGVALSLDGSSGTLSGNTMFRYLGVNYNTNTQWFEGDIGQIVTYQETLTAPQASALYASGTPVNPMALSPLPTAYYPLGGGSTGSASTLTVPNDSVPSATVFDFDSSSSQYVDLNSIDLGTTNTISFWHKRGNTTSNQHVLGSPDGTQTYIIYFTSGYIYIRPDGSTQFLSPFLGNTPYPFPPYKNTTDWANYIVTRNGDTIKLYLNGVEFALSGSGSGMAATTINAIANKGVGVSNTLDGEMSNMVIWNSDQTAEISNIYNSGIPATSYTNTPTAWYKLNVDTSTWDGTNWIIGEAQANYSSALNFDGTVGEIALTSPFVAAGEFTLSLWINPDNVVDNNFLGNGGAGSNWLQIKTASQIKIKIASSAAIAFTESGGNNLTASAWNHILIYRDSSNNVGAYVNGQTFGSAGSNTSTLTLSTIGRATGIFFEGDISNTAFWTSDQSANVATLYNGGTPEASISFSPTGWWKLDNLTTGIQDSAGSNNGTNNGATVTDIQVSTLNGTSSAMTTANLVTSDLTRSIPYSSYSMVFDGALDAINMSSAINLPASSSFSLWFNNAGAGSAAYGGTLICSPYIYQAGYDDTFAVALKNTNVLTLESYDGTSGTYTNPIDATTITNDVWYNLIGVLTYTDASNSSMQFYLNGSSFGSAISLSGRNLNGLANGLILGAYDLAGTGIGNNYRYNGKMSNVSIYSSALTEDQILTIYNGGVPNNISSLSPVGWWSLAGDSYYDGTNWICPDLGSGGVNGTSANMGGSELVGNGPGSTANGIATSMDIPANLKGNAPNSTNNAISINMTAIDRVTSVPG